LNSQGKHFGSIIIFNIDQWSSWIMCITLW